MISPLSFNCLVEKTCTVTLPVGVPLRLLQPKTLPVTFTVCSVVELPMVNFSDRLCVNATPAPPVEARFSAAAVVIPKREASLVGSLTVIVTSP